MPKTIDSIIIHCSDSDWGTAREIRKWHTDAPPNGRGWTDIGYQFVIMNGRPTPRQELAALDGSIECGRYLDEDNIIEPNELGIHALGYNDRSIGICLVGRSFEGKKSFTIRQFDSLKEMLFELVKLHNIPVKNVLGHCETESGKSQGKTCPDFDVEDFRTWLKGRV